MDEFMVSGVTDIDEVGKAIEQYPDLIESITKITSVKKLNVSEIYKFRNIVIVDAGIKINTVDEAIILSALPFLHDINTLISKELFYIRVFFEQFLKTRTIDNLNINNIFTTQRDQLELKYGMLNFLSPTSITQEMFDFFVAIKLKRLTIHQSFHVEDLSKLHLDEISFQQCEYQGCCDDKKCCYEGKSTFNVIGTFFPKISKFSLIVDDSLSTIQETLLDEWKDHFCNGLMPDSDTLQYLHFPIDVECLKVSCESYPGLKEIGIGCNKNRKIRPYASEEIRILEIERSIREDCAELERIILFSKFFDDKELIAHLIGMFPKIVVV